MAKTFQPRRAATSTPSLLLAALLPLVCPPIPSAAQEPGLAENENPLLSISGRITTTEGLPIAGATIAGIREVSSLKTETAISGDDGYYELTDLATSNRVIYFLAVYHKDYMYNFALRLDVPAGSQNVDVQLLPKGTIEGRIVNAKTRRPITRAELRIPHAGKSFGFGEEPTQIRNWRGRFTVPVTSWYPELQTQIEASANGYITTQHTVGHVAPGQTIQNIQIALEPDPAFEGPKVYFLNRFVAWTAIVILSAIIGLLCAYALKGTRAILLAALIPWFGLLAVLHTFEHGLPHRVGLQIDDVLTMQVSFTFLYLLPYSDASMGRLVGGTMAASIAGLLSALLGARYLFNKKPT